MEDDKLFELMSKMYAEMQQGFKEMRNDIVRIENKLDANSKTLFDGYEQTYELNIEMRDKIDLNTSSVDEINMSISEMKEDINYIAGKTIKNDSKINKIAEQLKAVK